LRWKKQIPWNAELMKAKAYCPFPLQPRLVNVIQPKVFVDGKNYYYVILFMFMFIYYISIDLYKESVLLTFV
jgi:hypothetical protein